jgi:hypothetical protein
MRKIKFFINIEKEEIWLNEMARKGYAFVQKSIGYKFQTAQADNTVIRIDYRTFKRRGDFEDYCELFNDCGWKHISGSSSSGAQYFKKTEQASSEDIFSDVDSKANRYKRMSNIWLALASSFTPMFLILLLTGTIDITVFINPKLLYYTPELWNKSGANFWNAFLFETPFALMRGVSWLVLPIMTMLCIIFAVKAKKQYQMSQKNSSECS